MCLLVPLLIVWLGSGAFWASSLPRGQSSRLTRSFCSWSSSGKWCFSERNTSSNDLQPLHPYFFLGVFTDPSSLCLLHQPLVRESLSCRLAWRHQTSPLQHHETQEAVQAASSGGVCVVCNHVVQMIAVFSPLFLQLIKTSPSAQFTCCCTGLAWSYADPWPYAALHIRAGSQ